MKKRLHIKLNADIDSMFSRYFNTFLQKREIIQKRKYQYKGNVYDSHKSYNFLNNCLLKDVTQLNTYINIFLYTSVCKLFK